MNNFNEVLIEILKMKDVERIEIDTEKQEIKKILKNSWQAKQSML